MLKKLRHRLVLFFTISTSLILTLVLFLSWIYQGYLENIRQENFFQTYLLEVTNKLEHDTHFSDDWLARLELDNRMVIHIEENGNPLFFSGSWSPATPREDLLSLAVEEAKLQNVDPSQPPLFSSVQKTSLLKLTGTHNDHYLGMVTLLPTENDYKSLILIQDLTTAYRTHLRQGIFFLFLDIAGCLSFYLISNFILQKAMAPIYDYQKRQNEFVAAASHELRSPLSVIQTSATALIENPESSFALVRQIQQECQRAGRLIRDLLLLASTDTKAAVKELVPVEVDELLLRLFESYEPLCTSKKIHLRLLLPETLLSPALAEPGYLYQILTILLDNAMAYGGNRVELIVSQVQKSLTITVADHGPGISNEEKEKIFLRFFRSDSSHSQKDHFGLGLSLAAQLAPLTLARLTVSDTPGGGASFCVFLKLV